MKKVAIFFCIISATLQLSAQPKEDKIEFNNVKQECLAIEYTYSPEAVENAFLLRMDRMGYKGKEEKGMFNKDKGFRVYKNISISAISTGHYDYVVNIDKANKRNDNRTVLYLIMMKDNANVFAGLNTAEQENAKKYLVDLLPDVEIANLEIMIKAQEEVVSKSEKKFKDLEEEKADLEKKITKLQEDIKKNEKDQEAQLKEIEFQKKALEELKSKRKN